jgi:sugar phosphate permease
LFSDDSGIHRFYFSTGRRPGSLNDSRKEHRFFYGWVVVAIGFLCLLATFGIRASFGAYVASWETEFAIGRTQVTLISVLSMITFVVFQPLMGRLIDRRGTRLVLNMSMLLTGGGLILASLATGLWQLVLLYSLIASIGMAGGSTVTVSAVVTQWFVEKRGTVMGLVLSGMAVGQLFVGPASVMLIDSYGWRLALKVFGIAVLLIVVPLCYFLFRSRPEEMGLAPYGAAEKIVADTDTGVPAPHLPLNHKFSVFRSRIFWLLAIPYFVCGFTDMGLISTHFIPYAEGQGYSAALIAVAFGSIAIFSFAGTIGAGFLSDRLNRPKFLRMIYWSRALIFLLLLTIFNNPVGLFIFAAIFGLTERASVPPTSSLCAHHFNDLSIGVVFGYVSISHHLGGALGSFIPGALFDLTGSYTIIFAISIGLLIGSGLLVSRIAKFA